MLTEVVGAFGWIDLLVNNAGVAPLVRKDVLETGEESFDRLIAINVKGPYFLTQAAANFWLSRAPAAPISRAQAEDRHHLFAFRLRPR